MAAPETSEETNNAAEASDQQVRAAGITECCDCFHPKNGQRFFA